VRECRDPAHTATAAPQLRRAAGRIRDSDGPLAPEGSLRGSLELLEAGFQRYGNRSRLHVITLFQLPGARRATDELRARHGLTQPLVWDHFWQR